MAIFGFLCRNDSDEFVAGVSYLCVLRKEQVFGLVLSLNQFDSYAYRSIYVGYYDSSFLINIAVSTADVVLVKTNSK